MESLGVTPSQVEHAFVSCCPTGETQSFHKEVEEKRRSWVLTNYTKGSKKKILNSA